MPSRDRVGARAGRWWRLLDKEWRELVSARAWWVLLLAMGPLVGVAFIDAVQTYAEASGLHGTSVGVGEAFSPLIGIWAPTFSASELAAAFLLPFVAIRLVAGDRQSGALKLELQQPIPASARIAVKAFILFVGWSVASIASVVAIVLWKSYGGSLYPPEIAAAAAGHLLNAGLTIALASAAASLTDHPATAAIVTLAVTVGTWVINFVAAVHGGLWEDLAAYTPTAMVAQFQHGLVRLDVVVVAVSLTAAGLALASVWMRLGVAVRRRVYESTVIAAVTVVLVVAAMTLRTTWDLSEARMNSFARADERALRAISEPLQIEVHLAPEDPRRSDLDRHALAKLHRLLPSVRIAYVSTTSIGLFEQTSEHYGEIQYTMNGRTAVSRSTTAEGVLETIYSLAGVRPPIAGAADNDETFRGHPLAVPPTGAGIVFYGAWPAIVLIAALVQRRRG